VTPEPIIPGSYVTVSVKLKDKDAVLGNALLAKRFTHLQLCLWKGSTDNFNLQDKILVGRLPLKGIESEPPN
jgi:hypothetical protein